MKKILISISLLVSFVQAWALDTYNPANGQLTIPLVQVGTTTYSNVVVTIGNVLSVGNGNSKTAIDVYDTSTGQLNISNVLVVSAIYSNVVVTISNVISADGAKVNVLKQQVPSNIFSQAGVWQAVDDSYISSTNAGGHTSSYGNINLFGSKGQSIILSGWSFSGWTGATAITPIRVGLLVQQPDGTLSLQTSKYIQDTQTNGNWLPLIADFNGDGYQDIFLAAHNESPNLQSASTVYLSNSAGNFTKNILTDAVQAHQPNLIYINNTPIVFASTFGPGPTTYQYRNGIGFQVNTFNVNPSIGPYGDANAEGDFLGNGQLQYINSDVAWDYSFTSQKTGPNSLMYMYGLNTSLQIQPSHLATFYPYFNNSKYNSYFQGTDSEVLQPRIWADDFNNDGLLDVVSISGIWSPNSTLNWSKSIIQMFQNKGSFKFVDVTDTLNSSFDTNSAPDYEMQILDVDKSGIKSYLVGQGSYGGHVGEDGNYLLLNDGTGMLYPALHIQFLDWGRQVYNFLDPKNFPGYIGTNGNPNFRAYLNASGNINYVADVNGSILNNKGIWVTQNIFVNVPVNISITTDFTQNITVSDRNNSMKMRTWAGNDVFYDINANSKPTTIDGGLGLNKVIYSGSSSQYIVSRNTNGTTSVVSSNSAPIQINDTLTNIQQIQFTDKTITLY